MSSDLSKMTFMIAALVAALMAAVMIGAWWTKSPAPAYGEMTAEGVCMIGGGSGNASMETPGVQRMAMFQGKAAPSGEGILQLMPLSGTVSDFYVRLSRPLDPGEEFIFTVVRTGVETSVTCTINAGELSCSDQANSASFAAGDYILVKSTKQSGGPSLHVQWTAKFAPSPAAAVGGIAEYPDVAGTGGGYNYMAAGAVVAAALVAVGGGAWYARRRWLG